jgi:hypothetical protein
MDLHPGILRRADALHAEWFATIGRMGHPGCRMVFAIELLSSINVRLKS